MGYMDHVIKELADGLENSWNLHTQGDARAWGR